jgi:hypothetical protein
MYLVGFVYQDGFGHLSALAKARKGESLLESIC